MVFIRSVPPRQYQDYTRYRELLRKDFKYRCAYCLIPEFHNGGMANFVIDHFRPRKGLYARPDLEAVYGNLYWCCSECNQNKSDHWPHPKQEAEGLRWIDPCEAWGDHDLNWQIFPDGSVQWLTPAGEFTGRQLMLDERNNWKAYWRKVYQHQQMRDLLRNELLDNVLSDLERARVEYQLAEIDEFLNPPVFDRPRRR